MYIMRICPSCFISEREPSKSGTKPVPYAFRHGARPVAVAVHEGLVALFNLAQHGGFHGHEGSPIAGW